MAGEREEVLVHRHQHFQIQSGTRDNCIFLFLSSFPLFSLLCPRNVNKTGRGTVYLKILQGWTGRLKQPKLLLQCWQPYTGHLVAHSGMGEEGDKQT